MNPVSGQDEGVEHKILFELCVECPSAPCVAAGKFVQSTTLLGGTGQDMAF